MKISILQKGGDKNHELIEKATRYFARKLMSTRMSNSLEIKILVRSTTLPKGVIGTCSTASVGSITSKKFEIELQKNTTLKEQIEILAHEMVHVWQKSNNTLQFRVWKSDKKMHVRWNGEETGLSDAIPYYDRPWEKEAYFLESKLNDCFRAENKGNIDDLPVHEKNLKTAIRCVINKRENDKSLTMS